MRTIDFSSWQTTLLTLFGLALVTAIGVGIRLVTMMTIQQRRERINRQINERLRTLIAAYKTLGGSFTGTLTVDPAHRRDLRRRGEAVPDDAADVAIDTGSDRGRRIRDAVEAALSDIILLGTDQQVRLAAQAAGELAASALQSRSIAKVSPVSHIGPTMCAVIRSAVGSTASKSCHAP